MPQRRRLGVMPLTVLIASLLLIAAEPVTKPISPDIAMPILGRTVYSPSGDTVGRVVDVLVDAAGLPQAAVLDVGGFLGLGNRTIAVHWSTLRFRPSDHDHPITIDMPADEIKAAPEYTDTTAPAQVVMHPARAAAAVAAPVAVHVAPPPVAPPPVAPPPVATPPAGTAANDTSKTPDASKPPGADK